MLRTPRAGNGVFARVDLPAGWWWCDHPVCVPAAAAEGGGHGSRFPRRLPPIDAVDDLMAEIARGAYSGESEAYAEMMEGPLCMPHLARHLEMQGEGPDEMPEWCAEVEMDAPGYNRLAAQLQSNVARDAGGDAYVLLPRIRFVNHGCEANTELVAAPDAFAGCTCGAGHYALRTTRAVAAGEELRFSYIGTGALREPHELEARRAILARRWGFACDCALCATQEALDAGGA